MKSARNKPKLMMDLKAVSPEKLLQERLKFVLSVVKTVLVPAAKMDSLLILILVSATNVLLVALHVALQIKTIVLFVCPVHIS